MRILDKIINPQDIKKLNISELKQLAIEIRREITLTVMMNGGHLSSNLGVVELTLALHYVFDLPTDKIIWDVGHQCYAHKIITGRKDEFKNIRKYGGISGFPKRSESIYDSFDTGHSSTSISSALGMARARDMKGEDYNIITVIGDGALGGGMAFEAMNDLGISHDRMIIILNDNKMSISANVGGISKHLDKLRIRPKYMRFKRSFEGFLKSIPWIGESLAKRIKGLKNKIRMLLIGATLFDRMGIRYIGPIDGNNLENLIKVLKNVKDEKYAIVLHVLTQKGKGFTKAEKDPEKYHGVASYIVENTEEANSSETFTDAFSKVIIDIASNDNKVVAITAAMPQGTGLSGFKNVFPGRFYDVGIAEEHAVTLAAGLAVGGAKPIFAVYSTFIQRAYDQVLHDVCIQNLPVVFVIDRAGLVGDDGETHQGIFDISFLRSMPNMHIFAPKNAVEIKQMLELALTINAPCAIRLPKDKIILCDNKTFTPWKWEQLKNGEDCAILAFGRMLNVALESAKILGTDNINAAVYNAGFIKPMDTETLIDIANKYKYIFTLEDSILAGGFGSAVTEFMQQNDICAKLKCFGINDRFVKHGKVSKLLIELGLDPCSISDKIKAVIK